jgi:hypothetical protein
MSSLDGLGTALTALLERDGPGGLHALVRLSGGANMETWSFD